MTSRSKTEGVKYFLTTGFSEQSGVKHCPILHNVIYGRPLREKTKIFINKQQNWCLNPVLLK